MKIPIFRFFILLSSILPYNKDHLIFYDYQEGLGKASEIDKPIFLLFTGAKCKNNLEVQSLLKTEKVKDQLEKFVQIHLYVDDPTKVAEPYKVFRDGKEIIIRTVGNKWAHLEIAKFGCNKQPYMLTIDHNEKIISGPKSYEDVVFGLQKFLKESEQIYREKKN